MTDAYINTVTICHEFYLYSLLLVESEKWDTVSLFWQKKKEEVKQKSGIFFSNVSKMFSDYLFTACLGESRYAKSNKCAGHYFACSFNKECPDGVNRFEMYVKNELVDRKDTLKKLVKIFTEKYWSDSTVGGCSWGNIAQTVLDYENNLIPDMIFIDRCFDLRHNGGKIFDKPIAFNQGVLTIRFLEYTDKMNTFLNLKRNSPDLIGTSVTLFTSKIAYDLWESLEYLKIAAALDVKWANSMKYYCEDVLYNYTPLARGNKKLKLLIK